LHLAGDHIITHGRSSLSPSRASAHPRAARLVAEEAEAEAEEQELKRELEKEEQEQEQVGAGGALTMK
jgi:hypothetical protein